MARFSAAARYLDHPTSSPLAELAARAVKTLSAAVASAGACGGHAAGFEHGVLANRDVGCSTWRPPTTAHWIR